MFDLEISLALIPRFNILGPMSKVWSLQNMGKIESRQLRLHLSELHISNYTGITLFPGKPPL